MTSDAMEKQIINGIWEDMNDRKGYNLDDLDGDVQKNIKESWRNIISPILAASNRAAVEEAFSIIESELFQHDYQPYQDYKYQRWNEVKNTLKE